MRRYGKELDLNFVLRQEKRRPRPHPRGQTPSNHRRRGVLSLVEGQDRATGKKRKVTTPGWWKKMLFRRY